jgi:ankyrin repeat protein
MSQTDIEGKIPLEIAARLNVEYICKELLDDVKDINDSFLIKGKATHEATQAGHLNILKLIVCPNFDEETSSKISDETRTILQKRDENEYTSLHLAAQQGNEKIII